MFPSCGHSPHFLSHHSLLYIFSHIWGRGKFKIGDSINELFFYSWLKRDPKAFHTTVYQMSNIKCFQIKRRCSIMRSAITQQKKEWHFTDLVCGILWCENIPGLLKCRKQHYSKRFLKIALADVPRWTLKFNIRRGAGWESVELSGKVWDSAHPVSCDPWPRDRGPGNW